MSDILKKYIISNTLKKHIMSNTLNRLNRLKKYKGIKVFIYCGGKCGSTTLENSLKQYMPLRLHNNNSLDVSIFDIINQNASIHDKIYIIDSYRTPIERSVSSFFENINKHLPNYKKYKLRDLIHYFNDKHIYNLEEYHPIDEIMSHYNLPLFDTFDFEKKYNLLVYKNINFIKIRFNDIYNWSNILSEIFQTPITLQNDNISKNKDYNNLYNNFKKVYYLPNLYYDVTLPNNKNFKIYNTIDEQKKYYEKWKKRLLPNL